MIKHVSLLALTIFSLTASSQDSIRIDYAYELNLLESELDSLEIFGLIDKILLEEKLFLSSELNVRFGYNSSIVSAGRDYEINQSGLTSGVSYYHKSGLYTDLSGYWNEGVNPNYNPTIFNAGFIGGQKKLTYSFDYEHWFYNPQDTSQNNLNNSIGGSFSYNSNNWNIGLDYSFLFGKETANRFIGSLGYNLPLGQFWIFKYVNFFPTANILIGNSDLTTLRITTQQLSSNELKFTERLISASELTPFKRARIIRRLNRDLENNLINQEKYDRIINTLNLGSTLSQEDVNELKELLSSGVDTSEDLIEEETFGLLNYSFSLPLTLSTNKFGILLNYTYSIPIQLPGEIYSFDPVGFFGTTLFFRLSTK